jgi:hypothetical protein
MMLLRRVSVNGTRQASTWARLYSQYCGCKNYGLSSRDAEWPPLNGGFADQFANATIVCDAELPSAISVRDYAHIMALSEGIG